MSGDAIPEICERCGEPPARHARAIVAIYESPFNPTKTESSLVCPTALYLEAAPAPHPADEKPPRKGAAKA
jgi:hypothetical protein